MNYFKLFIPIILCCLSCNFSSAQKPPLKGYLITSSGDTIVANFSSFKQKNTPQVFEYVPEASQEILSAHAGKVNEVGFDTGKKYLSRVIDVDKFFSKDIGKTGANRTVVTKSEKLFIELIADGNLKIAKYVNGDLERFYYQNESGKFVMLEFNLYTYKGKLMTNDTYRFQLKELLKDASLPPHQFSELTYTESSILKLIKAYYEQEQFPIKYINLKEKSKVEPRRMISIRVRPGLRLNSLEVDKSETPMEDDIDFGSQLGLRLGTEFEITPYGSEHWSILFEPTFQYFDASRTIQNTAMFAKHYTLELVLGARYYIWERDKSKIFANFSILYDAPISSKTNLDVTRRTPKTSLESTLGFNAGLGFMINSKYSLEFNYSLPRDIVNEFFRPTSTYTGFSLIFGYTIF